MRRLALLVILASLSLGSTASAVGPAGKRVGLGVILGEPTGFSLEAYVTHRSAIDVAVGWDTFGERDFYVHLDYLAMPADFVRSGGITMPFYLGIGAFLLDFRDDVYGGVRVPIGFAIDFRAAPLQLFFEVAVRVLVFSPYEPSHRLDLDGALGFRVFF